MVVSNHNLREEIRKIKLPDTKVYSTQDLTIGNLVDKSLENQLLALLTQALEEAAARKLMLKKRTIQEWGVITGVEVLDPDGFDRKDPQLMKRLFTYEEWEHGLLASTIQKPLKPDYLKTFFDKPVGELPDKLRQSERPSNE